MFSSEVKIQECTIELAPSVHYICRSFRDQREAKGISQEMVAQAAGIAVVTYGHLERCATPSGALPNPKLHTLLRIYDALSMKPLFAL
ncbi:helix-turn-helix domain-containing protein [Microbacterium sp. Leaf203]|uniref:helix-turn-helix domain-containing protein n=1 Tax=Microbacterium sp. Leaf203 TaxID=1735677 RepID=UPI0034DD35AC